MNPSRLVLISGWAYPSRAWSRTIATLAPDWEVSVVDSHSVLNGDDAGVPGVGARIRAEVESRAPCVFGGWSLGGMLALEHAESIGSLIDGLLLLSSTPRFCAGPDHASGVPPSELRAIQTGVRRDPVKTLTDFYARSALPDAPPPQYSDWADEIAAEDLLTGLSYLADTDLRSRVRPEGLPLVVLQGAEDAVVPLDAASELAAQLQPCHLDIIPGAGHDFPLRLPGKIREALDRIGSP